MELRPTTIYLLAVLVELIILLPFVYIYRPGHGLETYAVVVQIIGGFIATFASVHLSLNYSWNQQKRIKQSEDRQLYISTLKIVTLELALNLSLLKDLIGDYGIKKLPRTANLGSNVNFLNTHCKAIKTTSYDNTVSSGGMYEVSKNLHVFGMLQIAYHNIELTKNSLLLLAAIFNGEDAMQLGPENIDGLLQDAERKIKKTVKHIEQTVDAMKGELAAEGLTFGEISLEE